MTISLKFLLIHRSEVTTLIHLITVFTLSNTTGTEISCEMKSIDSWDGEIDHRSCWMGALTVIDSDDTSIEADETIGALNFVGFKQNIEFLPVEVAISFSGLKYYSASNCAIKTIDKVHFKDLRFLKTLRLNGNQIVEIKFDTFEDLVSLESLNLGERRFSLN